MILPVDNAVMEPELYSLQLDGISFHAAHLTTSERAEMPQQGMDVAQLFPEMGVDAVVYACAETSFLEGTDANSVIIDRITQSTGLPAITATWAMVLALRHIGAGRISLVTPYTEQRGAVMEDFLGRSGINVVRSVHRDFQAGTDEKREWYHTNVQPPSTAYRMARDLGAADVDAVLMSATNFRTFEVLDQLESDLGCPVISCNQAILWWFAQATGLPGVPPMGRLGRSQ